MGFSHIFRTFVDMFSKIAFSASLITVSLSAPSGPSLTDDSCQWIGGTYGQPLQCPEGSMVTGTCGSGATADCDGYHNEIYCCAISQSSNCGWVGGADGDLVSCDNGQSVRGLCGSGARADCRVTGDKQYFATLCCDTSDYSLDTTKLTYMLYSGYGERIQCNDGDVMVAGCGSGGYAACTGVNMDHGFTLEEIMEIQERVQAGQYNAVKCSPIVMN